MRSEGLTSSRARSHVCIVSQYWSPDVVGDVSRLKQIVSVLKSEGLSIDLVTSVPHYPNGTSNRKGMHTKRVSWEEGVRVIRVPMPNLPHRGFLNRLILYSWFTAIAAVPTLVFTRRGFVWTFGQRVFSTYAAFPAQLLRGAKIVSDVTDVWPEALVNTGYIREGSLAFSIGRALASSAYRACKAMTTISGTMAGIISAEYRVPKKKLFVLPYVGRRFEESPPSESDNFTALYYGTIGPNYDFGVVVEAAKNLESTGVKFIIRGDGEGLLGLRKDLDKHQPRNLRLITEVLSERELSNLVSSADVLVLPMARQIHLDVSFPGKFVEYLYAKKPIAYVGEGLPAHLVREHDLGAVIGLNDAAALGAFILKVKGDRGLLMKFGENAGRLSTEMFSPEALRTSLERLLVYVSGGDS